MTDSASDNEEPEPYHTRLRKTARSPPLITLSSDSEDDDVSIVKEDCNLQPSIIECIARVKIEQISDEEKQEKTRHSSSSKNSDSKKEKRNNAREKTQRSENSSTGDEILDDARNSKSSPSNDPSLKGETSSNSNVSRFGFRKKGPRWCTSYYKRKKILAKQGKRPIGRPRKYMSRKNFRKNCDQYPVSKTQHNSDSVDSSAQSDTVENEQNNDKARRPARTDESSSNIAVCQVKKRGRPKAIPDGIKRKRGRPKLSESEIRFRKKQRALVFGKKLIVKKRGRPRLSESDSSVKKKGRPKLQRDEAQPVMHSVRHVSAKSRTFVQSMNCFNESMKLYKCRECRKAAYNRSSWDMANSYCRFLEYRKLFAARNGSILSAGFLQPSDATESDKRLWLPIVGNPPMGLTIETAMELLVQVGDQFCDLVQQEKEAFSLHVGPAKSMTWKKLVQGVREMCDVCDTTLFNIHWVCPKCGFAVCIDCYKVRKQGIIIEDEESQMKGRDDYLWLFCHNRVPHEQNRLIMAQMIPGDALWTMSDTMHRVREKWNIGAYCKCNPQANLNSSRNCVDTGICKQLMSNVSKSFAAVSVNNNIPVADDLYFVNIDIPNSAAKWLRDMNEEDRAFKKVVSETNNSRSKNGMVPSFIRYEMVTDIESAFDTPLDSKNDSEPISLSEIFKNVKKSKTKARNDRMKDTLKEFNSRYPQPSGGRQPLPLRISTSTESSMAYKDIPHSWLSNGRLLLLHQPDHRGNLELFQEQWKRGQPIMVMAVDAKLNMSLWHPDGFCRDFGDIKNDLVNCKTGAIIPNLPMRTFWLGFENFEERMKDDSGEYMLLKLKDWPPGEDFSEKLPTRFQDLMQGLPLPEYTHRDGIFNLAGRLPSWFVRPDLGPKMYNAYGSALFPSKGTTNLHLDVSDAVNVMVYVGIPHDGKDEHHILEALKAIDIGGCDSLTRERVRSKGVRPGALWHIYDSRNADKIRDLLTKVAVERGEKLEAHHDPIHDQSWYLDSELRKRLYVEYGVEGYAIAQCLGDAVFIPAGAPHQVRNLHSCVKVAEDFVSPENIGHCFKLTQEFRHLSDTHTNHEDKLQIKNIIYHVVKDALARLLVENNHISNFLTNF